MYEVRFHGIGGEGVVTAAELLAKAAVVDGKWSQALPYFTTERRGSPVMAFLRVDDSPIWIKSVIYGPDMVVVTNPSVMKFVDVTEGLKENGTALISTSKSSEDLQFDRKLNIQTIDAMEIANTVLKRPITNTVMLGALLGVKEIVTFQSLREAILEEFPSELASKNIEAVKIAYNKIREAKYSAASLARP